MSQAAPTWRGGAAAVPPHTLSVCPPNCLRAGGRAVARRPSALGPCRAAVLNRRPGKGATAPGKGPQTRPSRQSASPRRCKSGAMLQVEVQQRCLGAKSVCRLNPAGKPTMAVGRAGKHSRGSAQDPPLEGVLPARPLLPQGGRSCRTSLRRSLRLKSWAGRSGGRTEARLRG